MLVTWYMSKVLCHSHVLVLVPPSTSHLMRHALLPVIAHELRVFMCSHVCKEHLYDMLGTHVA